MTAAKARVWFVNRYFYPDESATGQLLSDLAFGLAQSGYEVHILCSRQLYGAADARLAAHETIRGVVVHRLWTTRFGRHRLLGRAVDYGSFYVSCAVALMRRLHSADIVVAKTDPPLISVVVAAAARIKGAVLINWLQDVFPEVATQLGANPLPAGFDRLLRRLRDASLRAAAVNVVLGSRMRDYLIARRVPAKQIQVIENWAGSEALHPKLASDSLLRSRLGLADRFVVGYSGNLGRAHEIETLLGAAAALCADDRIAFLFIGGGLKMDELKSRVEEQQLANFHFLPYQPRDGLGDSLAATDVHLVSLIPALEGLIVPSKFYSILAAARPVVFVGDPEGELARIIGQSRCGVVVAAGDSYGLVQAIRRLESDTSERQAMGLAARELLCARFSTRRAIAHWTALLNEVQSACMPRR
jgi:colanic acid biosynthesis glycosyl transferase WcaI